MKSERKVKSHPEENQYYICLLVFWELELLAQNLPVKFSFQLFSDYWIFRTPEGMEEERVFLISIKLNNYLRIHIRAQKKQLLFRRTKVNELLFTDVSNVTLWRAYVPVVYIHMMIIMMMKIMMRTTQRDKDWEAAEDVGCSSSIFTFALISYPVCQRRNERPSVGKHNTSK